MREERVARLLEDPEKLQELRQQRAERKTEKSERQQQNKGRLLEHANLVGPGLDRRRNRDSRRSSDDGSHRTCHYRIGLFIRGRVDGAEPAGNMRGG